MAPKYPVAPIAQLNYIQLTYMKEGKGVLGFTDPQPDLSLSCSRAVGNMKQSFCIYHLSFFILVDISSFPLVVFF